ncbi:hypothetical protein MPER_12147, partial [Moniliophthora perniciosa FA553]
DSQVIFQRADIWKYESPNSAHREYRWHVSSTFVVNVALKVSKGFPGSVVLSQNSAGHCSVAAPSLCTARAVREYLVNGTLPEPGTLCPIDGTPFSNATSATPEKRQSLEAGEDAELLRAWKQIGSPFNGKPRLSFLHMEQYTHTALDI